MSPKPAFQRLAADKQQQLLETVMQLYIDHPYEEVTARMLCKSLGLNPATFYRYFESKDSLLFYLVSILQDRYLAYELDRLNRLGVDENSYFPQFDTDKPEYYTQREDQFLLACNRFPRDVIHSLVFALAGQYQAYYRAVLERERAAGKLRADADIDLIAYMYATTGYNLMVYCQDRDMSQEEYVKRKEYFFYGFFYHGILTPAEERGKKE